MSEEHQVYRRETVQREICPDLCRQLAEGLGGMPVYMHVDGTKIDLREQNQTLEVRLEAGQEVTVEAHGPDATEANKRINWVRQVLAKPYQGG